MTLKSLDVDKGLPNFFQSPCEDILAKTNDTMSHIKLHSINQKHGQSVNSFLMYLCVSLPKCRYTNGKEQFTDQFIFGIIVCDIQKNLLKTIKKEDGIKKCLHETHKTESVIEQHKMTRIQRYSGYE